MFNNKAKDWILYRQNFNKSKFACINSEKMKIIL